MSKQITLDEVKRHNSEKSVWIVIHNDVYDVTKYLEEHPGGIEPLLDVAGKDGTKDFEDVGHSSDAREIMQKFKIGSLPASEQKVIWDSCCKGKSKWKKSRFAKPELKESKSWRTFDGAPSSSSNLKWAVVALAGALVIGIALKKYLG